MNLDWLRYSFGWDHGPVPQLSQNRVAEDGTRGSGTLYGMGLNYSLTGVFTTRSWLPKIGMTTPPQTLAEVRRLSCKS